jgi:hypothetical protein
MTVNILVKRTMFLLAQASSRVELLEIAEVGEDGANLDGASAIRLPAALALFLLVNAKVCRVAGARSAVCGVGDGFYLRGIWTFSCGWLRLFMRRA